MDIPRLFGQLYEQFTGQVSDGFTILEVTYSIGIGPGVLVFFNHFAGRRADGRPDTAGSGNAFPMRIRLDTTVLEASRRTPERKKGEKH